MLTYHEDPALCAARALEKAEKAFLSLPARTVLDEMSREFLDAEQSWEEADAAFADAVPSTPEGALAKLRALADLHEAMSLDDHSLEARHVRSLIAYLERFRQTGRM